MPSVLFSIFQSILSHTKDDIFMYPPVFNIAIPLARCYLGNHFLKDASDKVGEMTRTWAWVKKILEKVESSKV